MADWPSHKLKCGTESEKTGSIALKMLRELDNNIAIQHIRGALMLIGGRDNAIVFTHVKTGESYTCDIRYANQEEDNVLRKELKTDENFIDTMMVFLVSVERYSADASDAETGEVEKEVSFHKFSYPTAYELKYCKRSHKACREINPILRVPITLVINADEIDLVVDEQVVATFAVDCQ